MSSPRYLGLWSRVVSGALLNKLAKHLALLALLVILGRASGRTGISSLTIFFMVIGAAVIHRAARARQLRSGAPCHGPRDAS